MYSLRKASRMRRLARRGMSGAPASERPSPLLAAKPAQRTAPVAATQPGGRQDADGKRIDVQGARK